jgi:hypothetical protein
MVETAPGKRVAKKTPQRNVVVFSSYTGEPFHQLQQSDKDEIIANVSRSSRNQRAVSLGLFGASAAITVLGLLGEPASQQSTYFACGGALFAASTGSLLVLRLKADNAEYAQGAIRAQEQSIQPYTICQTQVDGEAPGPLSPTDIWVSRDVPLFQSSNVPVAATD